MIKINKFLYLILVALFLFVFVIIYSNNKPIVVEENNKNTVLEIDFKQDLNKPVVNKTYDDGSYTQLEEKYFKSEVRGNTLYIYLDKSFIWNKSEYDKNVLAILDDFENFEINVKGLKKGHSSIILNGENNETEIECIFNIIIDENLNISFSEGTIENQKDFIIE